MLFQARSFTEAGAARSWGACRDEDVRGLCSGARVARPGNLVTSLSK